MKSGSQTDYDQIFKKKNPTDFFLKNCYLWVNYSEKNNGNWSINKTIFLLQSKRKKKNESQKKA